MIATATADGGASLIRPPAKRPPLDLSPIEGSLPPAGAGSTAPLPAPPAPADAGYMTMLPFGNGINPVLMAPPTGAPVGTPQISPLSSYPVPPPDANLGGTAILPGATPAANPGAPIQGAPPAGAPILGSPTGGPAISPVTDPRVAQYQGYQDDAVAGLNNMDRRSMLQTLLKDFDTGQSEADTAAYAKSGRNSAAFGRIGSAMAAQDVNTITRQSMGDRNRYRNQLAADTIDKEIGDRFQRTGILGDLAGREFGYARSNRDEARDERAYGDRRGDLYRDEARGERGYADDRGDRYRDEARGERAWTYGTGRDSINDARTDREEYRGERGYQDSREAYDTDRRIQERTFQENLTDSAFNRSQARLTAGRQGNPSGVLGAAAGDFQGQSDATVQALIQYLTSLGIGAGSR